MGKYKSVILGLGLVVSTLGCAARPPVRAGASEAPERTGLERPASPASVADSAARWERIGMSTRGRPLEATTVGAGGASELRMLLVGGIHGDEPEGGRTINAVEAYLRVLRLPATVRIVRDVNPDGTAARTRSSSTGIDLNRNWPARNFEPGPSRGPVPLSEPETRALHDEIERFAPDLVLVVHSSARGPFVNYDGPAAGLAAAFAGAAAGSDPRWRVVPSMGYPTPGSLGSYVGVDLGVPILTLEFGRGHEPEAAWLAMREGVRAVIEQAQRAR